MKAELTTEEAYVIFLLRGIKKNGHGTLRVEVTAGKESLFKDESSHNKVAQFFDLK